MAVEMFRGPDHMAILSMGIYQSGVVGDRWLVR